MTECLLYFIIVTYGRKMDLQTYTEMTARGEYIEGGSPAHIFMTDAAREAQRITAEMNSGYRPPRNCAHSFPRLTGQPTDETFGLFPPFYTDFGKNIHVGKGVFINSGCCFQDQGGITLGDGCLIGHQVVIATLNHDLDPARRGECTPRPFGSEKTSGWVRMRPSSPASRWGTAPSSPRAQS